MTSSSRYLNLNALNAFPAAAAAFAPTSGRETGLGEPLLALHREVNRMFDDLFRTSLWPITAAQQVTQQVTQQAQQAAHQAVQLLSSPRLDLEERDDALLITTDLPGVALEDVDVKIEGHTLTISGERNSNSSSNSNRNESRDSNYRNSNDNQGSNNNSNQNQNRQEPRQENFHLLERSRGRFERVIQLPFAANANEIEASFDNGVLSIWLPKEEQQRSRRIEVRAANGQQRSQRGQQDSQGAQGHSSSYGSGQDSHSGLNAGSSSPNKNVGSQPGSAGNTQGKPSSATSSADASRNKQPQPA